MAGSLKLNLLVGAIAERLLLGMAAAAQSDGSATGKSVGLAFLVNDFEISLDLDGAVVSYGYLRSGQGILRLKKL